MATKMKPKGGAGDERSANDAAVREMESELSQGGDDDDEPSDEDDGPPKPEVSVDDDEEEEEEEERPASRADKRRNRYRENQEAARLATERADKAERDLAEVRQNQARMEGVLQAQMQFRQQGPQQPQRDPLREEWDTMNDQGESLVLQYQNEAKTAMTPERHAWYRKQAADLELKKQLKVAQIHARDSGLRPVDPNEGLRAAIHAQNADVMGDPKARVFAQAHYNMLRHVDGKPDTQATLDEAMDKARQHFKLGKYKAGVKRDPSMRAKTSGAGGRGGSGGGDSVPRTIVMGKAEQAMARAMYSGKNPKTGKTFTKDEANSLWAKSVGKELVEEQATRRRG